MKNSIAVAMAAAINLSMVGVASADMMGDKHCMPMDKNGKNMVMAGKNDCKVKCKTAADRNSCAGQSKDGEKGAWINVPTGVCKDIKNGNWNNVPKDVCAKLNDVDVSKCMG